MSLRMRYLVGFTVMLSTTLAACSSFVTQPATPTAAGVQCPGGTLRSEADVAAYAHCQSVDGDLRITQSDLSDLSALAGLRSVSGTFEISGNPELEDLSGLEQLSSVGALEIRNNGIY